MIIFECGGCRRRLQVSEVYRGKRTRCPECAFVSVVPGVPERAPVPAPTHAVQETAPADEDTIGVAEEGPTCPNCRTVLPLGGVLCTNCGYDFRSGRQVETSHERFDQAWDVGLPLIVRVGAVLMLEFLLLVLAVLLQDLLAGLLLFFTGTVFLVLALGTYIRLHLVRTTRGKVLLTRTWNICFIPALRAQVNVRKYDRILIDTRGVQLTPYLIYFMLCISLRYAARWLPGPESTPGSYHIRLQKLRGRENFSLYHSTSDRQLREIVDALQELTGLPVDRN